MGLHRTPLCQYNPKPFKRLGSRCDRTLHIFQHKANLCLLPGWGLAPVCGFEKCQNPRHQKITPRKQAHPEFHRPLARADLEAAGANWRDHHIPSRLLKIFRPLPDGAPVLTGGGRGQVKDNRRADILHIPKTRRFLPMKKREGGVLLVFNTVESFLLIDWPKPERDFHGKKTGIWFPSRPLPRAIVQGSREWHIKAACRLAPDLPRHPHWDALQKLSDWSFSSVYVGPSRYLWIYTDKNSLLTVIFGTQKQHPVLLQLQGLQPEDADFHKLTHLTPYHIPLLTPLIQPTPLDKSLKNTPDWLTDLRKPDHDP